MKFLPSNSLEFLLPRFELAHAEWLETFNAHQSLLAQQIAILGMASAMLNEITEMCERTSAIISAHRRDFLDTPNGMVRSRDRQRTA